MENSEIITAIRSGDKEVIKEVYKDNAKDVYNFAKSITGDHDSAMNATKRTFVTLFNNIQKGEEPTNIRLAALKLAYDEACRIAMPSTENIDSPFDKNKDAEEETAEEAQESEVPETDADVESKARDEYENEDEDAQYDEAEREDEAAEEEELAEEEEAEEAEEPAKEYDINNTQVFNIKEALADGEDIEMDEEDEEYYDEDEYDEYDDEYDDDEPASRSKAATVIIVIINILLIIILLWLLYGLLVSFGVISDIIHIQVTYDFFNNHIYPIF